MRRENRILTALEALAAAPLEPDTRRPHVREERNRFAVEFARSIAEKLDCAVSHLSGVEDELNRCTAAFGPGITEPPRAWDGTSCSARADDCTPCRVRALIASSRAVAAMVRALLATPTGAQKLIGADRLAKSGRMVASMGTMVRSVASEIDVALRLARVGAWVGWRHHADLTPFERRFGDSTEVVVKQQEIDVVALSRTLLVEVKHIESCAVGTSTFDSLAEQIARYTAACAKWEAAYGIRPCVLVVFSSGFTEEAQRALRERCGCECSDLDGIGAAVSRIRAGAAPTAAAQPAWSPSAIVARVATRQREQQRWITRAAQGAGATRDVAYASQRAAAAAASARMVHAVVGVARSTTACARASATVAPASGDAVVAAPLLPPTATSSTGATAPYLLNQVSSSAYLDRLYAAVAMGLTREDCRDAPLVATPSQLAPQVVAPHAASPPTPVSPLVPINLCAEVVPYVVSDFWTASEQSLAAERRIKEVILADGSTLRDVPLGALRAVLTPGREFLLGPSCAPRPLQICRSAAADFESYLALRGSSAEQTKWAEAKGRRITVVDDTPLRDPLRAAAIRFSSPTGFLQHTSDPAAGHTAQTGFTFEEALGAGDKARALTAVSQLWTLAELGPFVSVVYLVDCGLHASLTGELIPNQPERLLCRVCAESKLCVGGFSVSQIKKAMRRQVAERGAPLKAGANAVLSGRALTRAVGRHPVPLLAVVTHAPSATPGADAAEQLPPTVVRGASAMNGEMYGGGVTAVSARKLRAGGRGVCGAICVKCELAEHNALDEERARRHRERCAQRWRSLAALLSDLYGGGSHARRYRNAALARSIIERLIAGSTLTEYLQNRPMKSSIIIRKLWSDIDGEFAAARGRAVWAASRAAARAAVLEKIAAEEELRDTVTVAALASLWSGGHEDEAVDDDAW